MTDVTVSRLPEDFQAWEELHGLIMTAFAYMDGVVDPPSSAHKLTPEGLRQKAMVETGFIATADGRLVGCIFAADRGDVLYVGKLAVTGASRGLGIGRLLMDAAERHARELGKSALELQTRIELVANHATFARLGFVEVERTAHEGYDRPTSLTLRKQLS